MMVTNLGASSKVLDALLAALVRAAAYNRDAQVAPAAVLWPDPAEQWRPLNQRQTGSRSVRGSGGL